jgi:hypothetical protein
MIRLLRVILLPTLLLIAAGANANTLIPGQSGAPDIFDASLIQAGGTLIYDSGSRPFRFDGGLTFGHYEEYVAVDSNNVFCGGCLTFGLEVWVDPLSAYSLTTVRFGLWAPILLTDIGYSPGLGGGTVTPGSVYRGTGNNVGFNFTGLTPGTHSQILIVETNSTTWGPGGIFFNDSNSVQSSTFGGIWAVPAPEPSSLALAGIGLVAVAAASWRRRKTR